MRPRLLIALLFLLCFAPAGMVLGQSCSTPAPTATPAPSYSDIVLNIAPGHLIAYWKLDETSGTVAYDSSGNGRNGTYNGVTLNSTTFEDGTPAGSWDGINDSVAIYSLSLSAAFSSDEGTLSAWSRVADSSTWTGGVDARVVYLAQSTLYRVMFSLIPTPNVFALAYRASSHKQINHSTTSTDWQHFALTWSVNDDEVKAYAGGAQTGSTLTGIPTWTGVLNSNQTAIGAASAVTPLANFPGNIAHVAIWDTPLSAGQISTLATVPIPVTPTPTGSATPCPTPTITPTADTYVFWTLPPPVTTGTPGPGQTVAMNFEMSAGGVMNGVLLFSLLITVILLIVILLLRKPKPKP